MTYLELGPFAMKGALDTEIDTIKEDFEDGLHSSGDICNNYNYSQYMEK